MAKNGRSGHLLMIVLASILVSVPIPVDARKKVKYSGTDKKGDIDSTGCKACMRMVMAMDKVIIPEFRAKMKGKDGKQFYIGSSSVALAEELSNVCKFDAITYLKSVLKECTSILEDYEDEILTVLFRHYNLNYEDDILSALIRNKEKHSLNLVGEICYDITKKCPSYVNATSTRQERPVHKGHLLTERKVEEKHQGFLRHIVAESWKEEVMNVERDVVTYLFTVWDDSSKKTKMAFVESAKLLRNCSTIKLGSVNLTANELPPPHGDFMKDDFEGIALWKGTDDKNGLNQHGRPVKEQPVYYTRDFRGEGLSAYDIVDYVFKNVGRNSSFECIREVSNKLSEDPEMIRRLQQKHEL